jgi:hypothetical protein
MDGASYPHVTLIGKTLAIVWGHIAAATGITDSLFLAKESSRGWDEPSRIAISGGVLWLDVVADRSTQLHVLYWTERTHRLGYGLWHDGRWDRDSLLAMGSVASYPRVSRVSADTLLLAWGTQIPVVGAASRGIPITMTTIGSTSCTA